MIPEPKKPFHEREQINSRANVYARKTTARHAVAPSGGIPAKSGSTMGSASCTLQDCSSTGVLSNNGTGTIFNPSTTAIAASAAIVYIINDAGLRVAIVESCS